MQGAGKAGPQLSRGPGTEKGSASHVTILSILILQQALRVSVLGGLGNGLSLPILQTGKAPSPPPPACQR